MGFKKQIISPKFSSLISKNLTLNHKKSCKICFKISLFNLHFAAVTLGTDTYHLQISADTSITTSHFTPSGSLRNCRLDSPSQKTSPTGQLGLLQGREVSRLGPQPGPACSVATPTISRTLTACQKRSPVDLLYYHFLHL